MLSDLDMANVGMFKRVNKTVSNPPVKVISSDVRTLGNRDRNRGRMVRVVRHTLGRRDSCRMVMSEDAKGVR